MENLAKGPLPSIDVFTSSYKTECRNITGPLAYGGSSTSHYDAIDSFMGDFETGLPQNPPNNVKNNLSNDCSLQYENSPVNMMSFNLADDKQVRFTQRAYMNSAEEIDRSCAFSMLKAKPQVSVQDNTKWLLAGDGQQPLHPLDSDYNLFDMSTFHGSHSLGFENIETGNSMCHSNGMKQQISNSINSSDFGSDSLYDGEMQTPTVNPHRHSGKDNSPSFHSDTSTLGTPDGIDNGTHQMSFVQLRSYSEHLPNNDVSVPFNNFYRRISAGSPQQVQMYTSGYDVDGSSFITGSQVLGNSSQLEVGEFLCNQRDYSDSAYGSIQNKNSEDTANVLTKKNMNQSIEDQVKETVSHGKKFSDVGSPRAVGIHLPQDQSASVEELEANINSDIGLAGVALDNAQTTKSRRRGKNDDQSYIALISKAILQSPNKRLLLSDIYSYISERNPDLKCNQRAWRNSVRHNLSLNECFVKEERLGKGRGHYWTIHSACIADFARGDFRRRQARRRANKYSLESSKSENGSGQEFPHCYNDFVDSSTNNVLPQGDNSFYVVPSENIQQGLSSIRNQDGFAPDQF